MSLSEKMMTNEKLKLLNFVCTSRSDYRTLNSKVWKKAKILNWIYLSIIFFFIVLSFTPLYFDTQSENVLNLIWMKIINISVFLILIIDYVLRWITYPARIRNNSINPLFFFVFTSSSFFALLSLTSAGLFFGVSITPTNENLIRFAKALSILKIFRLILLLNIIPSFNILTEEFVKSRLIVFNLLFILTLIVIIISTIIYSVESGKNPEINSVGDAIYYSFVTVATVGFGDITCVTIEGRFLSVILGLIGAISLSIPFGIIVVSFTSRIKNKYHKYDNMDLSNMTTLVETLYVKIFRKPNAGQSEGHRKTLIISRLNKDEEKKLYNKIIELVGGEENIMEINYHDETLRIDVIDSRLINHELEVLANLLKLKVVSN